MLPSFKYFAAMKFLQDSKGQTVKMWEYSSFPTRMEKKKISRPHSDDPVWAMAATNPVEALQEADEAVQQDPVLRPTYWITHCLPVNVPVPFPICHSPCSSSRQQQEPSPPKLQRVYQTKARERSEKFKKKDDWLTGTSKHSCAYLKSSDPAEQMYWSR